MPFLHGISSFECTSYKMFQNIASQLPVIYFLFMFDISFYTNWYYYLQLFKTIDSKLSKKTFSLQISLFLVNANGFTQSPHSLKTAPWHAARDMMHIQLAILRYFARSTLEKFNLQEKIQFGMTILIRLKQKTFFWFQKRFIKFLGSFKFLGSW